MRATVERLFEQAIEQVGVTPQPASPLTQDHPLIRTPAEYGDLFSRAVRRDADDNGRQAEAHDDHATAIRARRLRNPGQLRRHERSRCTFSP
ncbi:hypothetical protein ABIF93_010446 [Bradyrhizobium japonicum]